MAKLKCGSGESKPLSLMEGGGLGRICFSQQKRRDDVGGIQLVEEAEKSDCHAAERKRGCGGYWIGNTRHPQKITSNKKTSENAELKDNFSYDREGRLSSSAAWKIHPK